LCSHWYKAASGAVARIRGPWVRGCPTRLAQEIALNPLLHYLCVVFSVFSLLAVIVRVGPRAAQDLVPSVGLGEGGGEGGTRRTWYSERTVQQGCRRMAAALPGE